MRIQQKIYSVTFDDHNGSMRSFTNGIKEFMDQENASRPLFTIRLRDDKGLPVDVNALGAGSFSINSEQHQDITKVIIEYGRLNGLPMDVRVEIDCPIESHLTYWNLSINNQTDYIIEWIQFPNVVVPNDLIATGGSARIVWPAMEGVLIEDADLREESWLKYRETGYPSKGWEGVFPGPCPTQFMAYYSNEGGLYFGSHDEHSHVKAIEFFKIDQGICLEMKLFPGGIGRGSFKMDYHVVIGVFAGDWHDAANIYREWYLGSNVEKPKRLHENANLPEWFKESPVVVTYPVRGQKDTGNMDANEYYPFTNASPHIANLSDALQSKVMALLMHWEGTAPWAPPYVWPPLGGEENFVQFADQLHEQGNLLGVYCSGIGWTNESNLVPEYTRKEQFEREHLVDIMCAAPNGDVPNSLICNGPIRWGHDMCPTNEFVSTVVAEEVSKIIGSGCDYIQYFDQNLGGLSYFCYAKNHGHPPAPGKWQKDAMIDIFKKLAEVVADSGKKVIIGCEAGAAEPFIPYMAFNDMRFNITLFFGNPIPLYQYIYHEYINNFMGNQNTAAAQIDTGRSPDNLLWRTAFSFIAGDMMTLVMKDHGRLNWDWGTDWNIPEPNQEDIVTFIRNINAWRTGAALPYLCHGRMLKPYPVENIRMIDTHFRNGKKITNPSLLSSLWSSPEGRQAQIIVNYTNEAQQFSLQLDKTVGNAVQVIRKSDGSDAKRQEVNADSLVHVRIEPLSAVMIQF